MCWERGYIIIFAGGSVSIAILLVTLLYGTCTPPLKRCESADLTRYFMSGRLKPFSSAERTRIAALITVNIIRNKGMRKIMSSLRYTATLPNLYMAMLILKYRIHKTINTTVITAAEYKMEF